MVLLRPGYDTTRKNNRGSPELTLLLKTIKPLLKHINLTLTQVRGILGFAFPF